MSLTQSRATAAPLMRKLEQLGPLSDRERQILAELSLDARPVPAGQDLVREGERSAHCLLLLDGVAARYKLLGEARQIVAFHVPGDLLDLAGLLLGRVDDSVGAVTPVKVAAVPHATILGWIEHSPQLGRLLWQDTLIDAAVFREWVVNVGRRTPYWRTAHLLCELVARLRAAGLAQGEPCEIPVPRPALADALGLSPVLVNRALQELQGEGLIELRGEVLLVLDWAGLKQAAGYDPAYLHQFAAAAA